jgi:hypothetical protein
VSALDWPELRKEAVVPQPAGPPLVLLQVGWPAHPRRSAGGTMFVVLGAAMAIIGS